MMRTGHCLAVAVALSGKAWAGDVAMQSGPARVHLLELFTSEGCSSCPPAEKWFSTLRQSPRLWKDFVPISFHVDYWDHLGWRDALATKAFTSRQYRYATSWGLTSVYTPGFVLDGREWRGMDLARLPAAGAPVGTLTANWHDTGDVQVSWAPATKGADFWQANVALLRFGLGSEVKAGENSGRKLLHDFSVVAEQEIAMSPGEGGWRATLELPAAKPGQSALAVWISSGRNMECVQAAGGGL